MIEDDRPYEVSVHAGEPRPTWCDHCQRRAAFTVPILTVDGAGVSVLGNATGCLECRSGCFADDLTL